MTESSANEPLRHERLSDLADADVPAEDSPVPAGPATVPWDARPWPGPDRLVLRAPYGSLALYGMLAVGPLFVLLFAAALLVSGARPLAFAFVLVPPTLIWVLIWTRTWYGQTILPRVTFDRAAGLLTLGWTGLRGRRPLASVIGVQVMQTRKQFGSPELDMPTLTMYQMNLILDDPAEQRLNVMTCDLWRARSNARLIADFLGVPVLDREGPSAAPAAAGAAAPRPTESGTVPSPVVAEPEGSRDWASWPDGSWTVPSPVVTEPGPDVLVIRPRRRAFLDGFRRMGTALAVLLLLAGGRGHLWAGWPSLAFVGALVCFLLLLPNMLGKARFDRVRGVLTLGRPRRRALLPLASVKAVEVVASPFYRLDLVSHDPRQPRLNLILGSDADAALVRRAADQVASFLGVPLLGAGRQTPAAAQPGGGQPVAPLEGLDRAPVPPGGASVRGPACLVRKGDDVLVLRPRSRLSRVWPAAVLMVGLVLFMVWLTRAGPAGPGQAAAWWTVVLLGALSPVAAFKPLLLFRDHFDRQAGRLTLGWFGHKGTYPLANVLAVQLVPGWLVEKAAGPFGRGRERVSYQLNLVLADAYQDRLNLTNDSDLGWTRQAGRQVADFLGVPVLDQIADD